MNTLYKTEISDVRWMAYDIPGNIGWIAYLVCVFRALREKRDAYNFASAFPGVLMLIGVGELISERIAGLDRIPCVFTERASIDFDPALFWIRLSLDFFRLWSIMRLENTNRLSPALIQGKPSSHQAL